MTVLSPASPQTAATRIRTSRLAILAVGTLACLSGLIPTAFILLPI